MKKELIKVFAIVVLVIIGIFLYQISPETNQIKANPTSTQLTTTWEATEFIDAQSITEAGNILETTIGVSKWHNRTFQGDRLIYEETWSAHTPTAGDNRQFIFYREGNTMAVRLPAGFTQRDLYSGWLVNAAGMDIRGFDSGRVIRFIFTPISPAVDSGAGAGRSDFAYLGNAVNCLRGGGDSNARCIYATGSYGFNLTSNLGDGVEESFDSFGALIPIKWTVNGTIH